MSILVYRRNRQIAGGGLVTVADAGNTRTLTVTAATASDQETATSTTVAVVPNVQQRHPSAAKCWAAVSVSGGTPSLDVSYNITSITDTGVGDLTITIATDFSSANWCAIATGELSGLLSGPFESHVAILGKAAGSVEIGRTNATPTAADPTGWYFVGYGDQ